MRWVWYMVYTYIPICAPRIWGFMLGYAEIWGKHAPFLFKIAQICAKISEIAEIEGLRAK